MKTQKMFISIFVFCFFSLAVHGVTAEPAIVVDFYYSHTCGTCTKVEPIVAEIKQEYEANYSGKIIFNIKDIAQNQSYYTEMQSRGLKGYPSIIINNETKITSDTLILKNQSDAEKNRVKENITTILNSYVAQLPRDTGMNMMYLILVFAVAVSIVVVAFAYAYRRQKKKE